MTELPRHDVTHQQSETTMHTTPCSQLLAAALLVTSLAACSSAEHAVMPTTDARMVVSPDLLAAVSDAEQRVAPVLNDGLRVPLQQALTELHAALSAGQLGRSRQALDAVRMLVTASAPAVADVADLAAIETLVGAAHQVLDPGATR
jgi:hypothetical protein